jgi:probable HAF family extracellular repeat protein
VAINSDGQAVGIDDDNKTFVVAMDGTRKSLGVYQEGALTIGVAIAENGDVAGYSEGETGRKAVLYSGNAWHAIEGLGDWSAAFGIGDTGQVVGALRSSDGLMRGFSSTEGALSNLPLPEDRSSALYLSVADRVAGIVETPNGETHAFVIRDGALKDVGTLGGRLSSPIGMNAKGDLVGAAETATGDRHAFFLGANDSKMVNLGRPFNAIATDARGVDDQGRIAGNAEDGDGASHPVIFDVNKPEIEIMPTDAAGKPYASAHVAMSLGDGRIIGWGVSKADGAVHCILWTPKG